MYKVTVGVDLISGVRRPNQIFYRSGKSSRSVKCSQDIISKTV